MRLDIIGRVARKELTLFFASPIGYLFLGAYLLATLFIFFWAEQFFARNIADVRPLFEWLPVLLIFLTAAITMRMWSEERRSGTLEFVATVPVSTWEFVVGKFLACWILTFIALLLTLPLPVSVSLIGNLDWGPVFAGYLAAMLLGGAYLAIGLFVSARTDSQIVSLIVACLLCGVFYMLGNPTITELFSAGTREFLSALGSGSRFESITRGVIDFRDLYYYFSIAAVFLVFNVYSLASERWASDSADKQSNHRNWRLGSGLLVLNLLIANIWLGQVTSLRADMTRDDIFSISDATRGYLAQLQEPLLIRGYFSAKTHSLLAPLVPRMKDLLREYEIAGKGKVRVEIVDPVTDPEIENEANTKYGIRAVPFQVADRYQASLVNSYFDVLVAYGDEYEVLGFRDLMEVKVQGETDLDVQLKNPEFDVTRAIKKVLYGFQGGGSVFDNIVEPVQFVGYISDPATLPEPLVELRAALDEVLAEIKMQGGDKFDVQIVDPQADGGQVAQEIAERFGFQPMAASLFDEQRFYYYLTLQGQDTAVQVPIPEALSAESLKRGFEDGLKRFASGLLKSVVLAKPQPPPAYMQQQGAPPVNEFEQLQGFLTNDFEVTTDDLSSGAVPATADLLIVVDPENFTSRQVFAIDQFLMKGGTVVIASGAYAAQPTQGRLLATRRVSGLDEWLAHQGIDVGPSLVMDSQNASFPVPVTRQVGGFSFQDLVMLDYPYFVDVREEGMNNANNVLSGIPSVTVSWASPLTLNAPETISSTVLLRSSPGSWLSQDTDVMPQVDENGLSGFTPTGEVGSHPLGVLLEGRFESFFKGQASPLLNPDEAGRDDEPDAADDSEAQAEDGADLGIVSSVIEHSPESARLLVFASNDFLADQTLRMIGSADGTLYGNSVQLIANIIDWSLEDQNLIGIRARGNFNRTLPNLDDSARSQIEYVNYLLALLGIGLVMLFFRWRKTVRANLHRRWLGAAGGQA